MILYDGTIGETTSDDANKIEPNELKPKLNLSTHTRTHQKKERERRDCSKKRTYITKKGRGNKKNSTPFTTITTLLPNKRHMRRARE